MAWVINVSIDADKPNVGSVSAVFTDTDSSNFSATSRGTLTAANATTFVNAAIAARNDWQARKTTEASDRTALIQKFAAAVPTESASATQVNDGFAAINLPG